MERGFFIVSKGDFKLLQPGDRIKYKRMDGKIREGGYIWYSKKGKHNRDFWMVSPVKEVSLGNPNVSRYPVFWDQMDTVWQQNSAEYEIMKDAVDMRKQEVERLKKIIMEQQLMINEMISFLEKKFGDEFNRSRRMSKSKARS